jgi:hypothetical protein
LTTSVPDSNHYTFSLNLYPGQATYVDTSGVPTMRLLNTASLELEEFTNNEIPQYAILSHTWENEEVSFQEMQQPSFDPTGGYSRPIPTKEKAGYKKIKSACTIATQHSLKYIWINTCCIDKTSSAELTESINSMYKWYQEAQICYVYLADVSTGNDDWKLNSALERSR